MDKLRAIKCFCAVVEAGSFVGAAEQLAVVPSALSKTIAGLEEELGLPLFNRTTRRVAVTEAGASYYDLCKRLVMDLDRADEVVRQGLASTRGQLIAGIHPSLIRPLLARMHEFTEKNPDITIETNLGSTISTILEDKVDVLLSLGSPPDSATLGVSQLGMTKHILVASPHYIRKSGKPDEPEALAQHRIIASARPDGPTYSRWTFYRGDETRIVFVSPRLINRQGIYMQDACLAGVGIARLAAIAVDRFLREGSLVRVLDEWNLGAFPICAVYPSHKGISNKTKLFVDFAREVLRPPIAASPTS